MGVGAQKCNDFSLAQTRSALKNWSTFDRDFLTYLTHEQINKQMSRFT